VTYLKFFHGYIGFVANCLEDLTFRGNGSVLSCTVATFCRFMIAPGVVIVGNTCMGSCVVVFVHTDATYLCAVTSLAIVAELLTFGTLGHWAC
jgi:hypothetical protein